MCNILLMRTTKRGGLIIQSTRTVSSRLIEQSQAIDSSAPVRSKIDSSLSVEGGLENALKKKGKKQGASFSVSMHLLLGLKTVEAVS